MWYLFIYIFEFCFSFYFLVQVFFRSSQSTGFPSHSLQPSLHRFLRCFPRMRDCFSSFSRLRIITLALAASSLTFFCCCLFFFGVVFTPVLLSGAKIIFALICEIYIYIPPLVFSLLWVLSFSYYYLFGGEYFISSIISVLVSRFVWLRFQQHEGPLCSFFLYIIHITFLSLSSSNSLCFLRNKTKRFHLVNCFFFFFFCLSHSFQVWEGAPSTSWRERTPRHSLLLIGSFWNVVSVFHFFFEVWIWFFGHNFFWFGNAIL